MHEYDDSLIISPTSSSLITLANEARANAPSFSSKEADRRHFLRGGLAAAGGLALATTPSCAFLEGLLGSAGYKNPRVRILDMSVEKWGLSSLGTLFDVELTNPNAVGFTLQGIGYGLKLAGNTLATGNSRNKVSLKAKGKSTTQLAVNFPLAESARALMSLLTKKSVPYQLDTSFKLGTSNWNVDVPVKHKGNMPVPQLPKVSVASFKFTNISLSSVSFRVVPEITNSNGFALPLDGLVSNITLNGKKVLSNRTSPATTLAPNKKTAVPIDFNVSLSQLGMSALALAQRPRVNWGLDLGLKTGKFKLPFKRNGSMRLG